MMSKYKYLMDSDFLKEIDNLKIKEQYTKIIVLDWDENPIQDIIGNVTGGTLNIDGKSSVRRTCNLTVFLDETENNILNVDNLISINKKVKIEIGYKNTTNKYKEYDIIWFPIGLYVIISASINHSNSNISIFLQLKDKMCLLNGEVGGVLPAAINFNELESYDEEGNIIITYPTIYQIIQEVVSHWGGEQLGKIIISDIDTRTKKVMKWNGSTPLYKYKEGDSWKMTTNESLLLASSQYEKFIKGDDIGYIYTDFYYSNGDLSNNPGDSVTSILDKIKNYLGNYEYFYDVDGNFIFQEIKNYLNTSHSTVELEKLNNSSYLLDQSKGKNAYNFNDGSLIISYSNSPQYHMIKNDFIVWGQREVEGKKIPIRYHLSIDKKPVIGNSYDIVKYYDENDGLLKAKSTILINTKSQLPKKGVVGILYYVKDINKVFKWDVKNNIYIDINASITNIITTDWRTELYLQGTMAEPLVLNSNDYFMELQNEWPKLYDIENQNYFYEVRKNPYEIDYFLDFIDSSSAINKFNISNIGKRTKIINDDKINCIFAPNIPNLIIIEAEGPGYSIKYSEDPKRMREEADAKGDKWIQVSPTLYSQMIGGGGWNSAYDCVRELLHQYTNYNETISIQAIPIFHLDANMRIGVTDLKSNIVGDYVINSINIPLNINGNMTISASKALQRI